MLKKLVITVVTFFNLFLNTNSLECMSMTNQKCRARPKIINVNTNDPAFYPVCKVNKCSGSCNNINNPYAKLCIPDIVKKINVKVFNLISRINESKQILWHETCKCVCKLSDAMCNSKQLWNDDRCRCECREDLVDKINCDKGYLWNPSNCECECNKSCSIEEYLDCKNCICRKSIVDKLIEECDTVIKENNTSVVLSNNDCTLYFSFFLVFLLLFLITIGVLIYFYWYKRRHTVTSTFNIEFNRKCQVNY